MAINLEKNEGSQLTDEEKRAKEERLKREEGETKQTGWEETFKVRQELTRETGRQIEAQRKTKLTEERQLTEEREGLAKTYDDQSSGKSPGIENEAKISIKEAEDELGRLLNEKKSSGKELSAAEIYNLTRDFYLNKLGYQARPKGIFGGKARIFGKKEGKYLIDEKTGKPVEFRRLSSPEGETPLLKFLKEKHERNIRDSLAGKTWEKDQAEKTGEKIDSREGVIRDLAEAWGEQEKAEKGLKKYLEQNLTGRLREKEDRWQEEINKTTNSRGEKLTEAEKRSLRQKFYLQELPNYEIKHDKGIKGALKGLWGALITGREKVKILKDGKPIEINGKQVEFKVNWYWRHPGEDLVEFLRSEVESKIKIDLEKEWGEKEESSKEEKEQEYRRLQELIGIQDAQKLAEAIEAAAQKEKEYQEWQKSVGARDAQKLAEAFEAYKTGKTKTQENIQEAPTGKAESEKKLLTQAEFFARYLTANNLDEKDITPAKLNELRQKWQTYQKEMGIETAEIQTGNKAAGERKEIKTEAGKTPAKKEKSERPKSRERKMSPATRERLIKFFENFSIEADESKRTEKDKGIKKALDDLEAGKIDSAGREISRMLRKSRENLESEMAKEERNPRLIKQHEDNIGKLRDFLREINLPAEEQNLPLRGEGFVASKPFFSETPHKKGIEFRPGQTSIKTEETKESVKETVKIEPEGEVAKVEASAEKDNETLTALDQEEESGRRPESNKRRSVKKEKTLEWLERAKKLRENGSFKFKMTAELKKFLRGRGYAEEQIRQMAKEPTLAWDEALELYNKEQREAGEK